MERQSIYLINIIAILKIIKTMIDLGRAQVMTPMTSFLDPPLRLQK